MTEDTNEHPKKPPQPGASRRRAVLYLVAALVCLLLAFLGLEAEEPRYIVIGSSILSGVSGGFFFLAIRETLRTKHTTPTTQR